MKYRCVQCGFGIKTLFVQYSPGNIRLMKCENCKAIADEYIECELMIILIDLILHKPKAYRHLLYNVLNQQTVELEGLLWKSTVTFLLFDAYRSLLLLRNKEEQSSALSFPSLVWRSQQLYYLSILDIHGCLCWKPYIPLRFCSRNKGFTEDFSWILQLWRYVACNPCFKLLQDVSRCHDGLGISIFCDFHN
ncbi:protein ARV 1 isoform X3 [Manihot esculenta]|uniref:protein ARV 1 isoform X3 n=1 Tax=Manihot esculenta TaxID=3983 RepID=UPI000B5D55A3|nr:protein ARV 1 isoform X3 [Manihot esculenta]